MTNLLQDPVFQELQFTKEWIELGLVNCDNFPEMKERYLKGMDNCTEHYRWGAFCDLMKSKQSFTEEMFYRIYDLGKKDPDPAMGRSMRIELVRLPNCPKDLLNLAIQDESTSKIILKILKKRELNQRY